MRGIGSELTWDILLHISSARPLGFQLLGKDGWDQDESSQSAADPPSSFTEKGFNQCSYHKPAALFIADGQ